MYYFYSKIGNLKSYTALHWCSFIMKRFFYLELEQDYSAQIWVLWLQYFNSIQARHACGHVDVGTCPHQVLAATLTLSQPWGVGADYARPILVSTPSFESHRRACKPKMHLFTKMSLITFFHTQNLLLEATRWKWKQQPMFGVGLCNIRQ